MVKVAAGLVDVAIIVYKGDGDINLWLLRYMEWWYFIESMVADAAYTAGYGVSCCISSVA